MTTPVTPSPETPSTSSSSSSQSGSLSFEEKFQTLSSQLFSLPQIQTNPFTQMVGSIGKWFELKFKFSKSIHTSVDTAEALIKEGKYSQARQTVSTLIDQFFQIHSGELFCHEKNIDYLSKKVSEIILNYEIQPESKKQTLQNVFDDALISFQEAQERVKSDIKEGRLQPLGISSHDELVSLQSLGAETHLKGKIPLLLEFKSGQKIVYKPRSMLPEHLICSKDGSLFAKAGLGTYGVIDTGKNYGYCEYLHNLESENTIDSLEELKSYYTKLAIMDQVCELLKVSDLHSENIITCRKIPYLIDAESFLNPPQIKTGMYDTSGAASTFKHNRVWLGPSFHVDASLVKEGISDQQLQQLGVDLATLKPPPLSSQLLTQIDSTRKALSTTSGRFVLIETQVLTSLFLQSDPYQPTTLHPFLDYVKDNVRPLGFQYLEGQDALILSKYQANLLHNDVPIFYYDHAQQTILYEGLIIAKKFLA